MLRKEQIEYALHYAEDPVEWVFELVRGLEKRIDELLKFGTKITVFQEHWRPASELPKDEEEVIAAGDYSTTRAVFHEGKYYIAEYYHDPESLNCALNGVKWWCYPPKED